MVNRNLQSPLQDECGYLIKESKELEDREITYFLEVGTCLGLMSSALKCANHVSQGQAS